jgi:MoxR-like ATPase
LEDVRNVAVPVLTHRIITTFAAQAEGIDAKRIVRRLMEETEA